ACTRFRGEYNPLVPLVGDFGDWATPEKSSTGLFCARTVWKTVLPANQLDERVVDLGIDRDDRVPAARAYTGAATLPRQKPLSSGALYASSSSGVSMRSPRR